MSTTRKKAKHAGKTCWNCEPLPASTRISPAKPSLPTYLEEIALVAATDDLTNEQDAVTLITMHQAKGLEYPVVFVIGLEEGIMPHSRSLEDREQLEEERRLLYVAATRAERRLYLMHAFKRTMFGRSNMASPSRFIQDIPPELLKKARERGERAGSAQSSMFTSRTNWGSGATESECNDAAVVARRPGALASARIRRRLRPAANAKFAAGMKVRHATFGEGVVVSSAPKADDEEVTIAFVGRASNACWRRSRSSKSSKIRPHIVGSKTLVCAGQSSVVGGHLQGGHMPTLELDR